MAADDLPEDKKKWESKCYDHLHEGKIGIWFRDALVLERECTSAAQHTPPMVKPHSTSATAYSANMNLCTTLLMTGAQKLDAGETTWIEKHDHEHGDDDDELDDDDNDDSGYDPDSNKTKIWNLRQVKPQKSNCTMAMTSPQVLPILWRLNRLWWIDLCCIALKMDHVVHCSIWWWVVPHHINLNQFASKECILVQFTADAGQRLR